MFIATKASATQGRLLQGESVELFYDAIASAVICYHDHDLLLLLLPYFHRDDNDDKTATATTSIYDYATTATPAAADDVESGMESGGLGTEVSGTSLKFGSKPAWSRGMSTKRLLPWQQALEENPEHIPVICHGPNGDVQNLLIPKSFTVELLDSELVVWS